MTDELYYVSPYCIFWPDPDNEKVTVVHGLYGSKFSMARDFFKTVIQFLSGHLIGQFPPDIKKELQTLIAEKILIDQDEFYRFNQENIFRNRLQPVELAFQRGFNEGGYFADRVEVNGPPGVSKEVHGAVSVPLKVHTPTVKKDAVECLMERRSIRAYSDRLLTLQEFEQFLQFAAKAYALVEVPQLGNISLRNYPSGGARYPLEIYPVVYNVQSLERGIYHYHPFQHRLTLLNTVEEYREALIRVMQQKMGAGDGQGQPAVIFVITAVLGRTCWKYTGTPLHLILQEVGALYQTMYLVATLLRLAPCSLGAFPELAIDEMLSIDSRDETQVGLFVLGTPKEDPGAPVAFVIEKFEIMEGSPFSPDKTRKSIELSFHNGQKEVMDLEDLRLEAFSDKPWFCYVMRGRYRAEFNDRAQETLRTLMKQGKILLSDRFKESMG